jgi:dihydroflavonol-4-reductase
MLKRPREIHMRAFVTGATGLLGANLVRALLERGHAVTALVRSEEKARRLLPPEVALARGDLAGVGAFAPALAGHDTVFHLAAYFREFYGPGDHAELLRRLNVDATVTLVRAARAAGVRRLVLTSSAGAVPGDRAHPGDESAPLAPAAEGNLYFESKVQMERAVGALDPSERPEVVTVLPAWMMGPWDDAPTTAGQLVLDFVRRRIPAVLDGGMTQVDARDVALGMIAAAERGRPGERYLLAGAQVTLEDVFRVLERLSGVPMPSRRVPFGLALAIATASEWASRLTGRPSAISRAGLRAIHGHHAVRSDKAARELGFQARPLEATLRDTLAWYAQRGRIQLPGAVEAHASA